MIDDLAGALAAPVADLDAQFQTIDHVQKNWALPSLPNEVITDLLAEQSIPNAAAQSDFLTGLSSDLRAATTRTQEFENRAADPADPGSQIPARQSSGLQQRLSTPGVLQEENAFVQDIRRNFAGIASVRSPEILVGDRDYAVRSIKSKMIAEGLLPEDTAIDNSWSPQLTAARREMLNLEAGRRLQGDRPGAIKTNRVLGFLDEWGSPSSLMASAMGLDQIDKALRGGENLLGKIGDFAKDPTLENFGHIAGAIDDVAIPIMNTYLTYSGFKGVLMFSQAARGAVAGKALGSIGGKEIGVLSQKTALEAERFAKPGLIAANFQKKGEGTIRNFAGDHMAAWRKATTVMMTKKAVQQVSKVGFIGQLEEVVFDTGLNDDRVQAFKDFRTKSTVGMAFSVALDIPLAPTTIFAPGVISKPLKAVARGLDSRLIELAQDERIAAMSFSALKNHAKRTNPQRHKIAMDIFSDSKNGGPVKSNVYLITGVAAKDQTADTYAKAGAQLQMLIGSAGIDKAAAVAASRVAAPGSTTYRQAYLTIRDHYIQRLRPLDFDEIPLTNNNGQRVVFDSTGRQNEMDPNVLKHFIEYRSGLESVDVDMNMYGIIDDASSEVGVLVNDHQKIAQARSTAKRNLEAYALEDPRSFKVFADEQIAHHNGLRNGSWNDVMDGLDEADIASYLEDTVETLVDWDKWTHGLNQAHDYVTDALERGDDLKLIFPSKIEQTWLPSLLEETELAGKMIPKKQATNKSFNAMAQRLSDGDGQVTMAKIDTPTKQDSFLLRRRLKHILDTRRKLGEFVQDSDALQMDGQFRESLGAYAAGQGKEIADLEPSDVFKWREQVRKDGAVSINSGKTQVATGRSFGPNEIQDYGNAAVILAQNGYDTSSGARWLDDQIRIINSSDFWSRTGVAQQQVDDVTGAVHVLTIDDKLAELARRERFLASEMIVPDDMAHDLAQNGYKAVYGRDFLFPGDLHGLGGPFQEVTRRALKRRSLGLFITREGNTAEQIVGLRRVNAEQHVSNQIQMSIQRTEGQVALGKTHKGDWDGPTNWDFTPGSDDMEHLFHLVQSQRAQMQDIAEDAEEAAEGFFSRTFTRARNSGLPFTTYDVRPKSLARALNGDPNLIAAGQKPLWGKNSLKAVHAGLLKGKELGVERQGAAILQDKIVNESWLRGALGVFKYSEAADDAGKMAEFKKIAKYAGFGRSQTRQDLDLFRNWQRAGGAILGAGITSQQFEGDPLAVAGGAIGGAILPGQVINPRNAVRFGAFNLGLAAADAQDVSPLGSIAAGLGAATVGVAGARAAATIAAKQGGLLDKAGWSNYSGLGEGLMHVRDRLRFALSPVFDIQRYTEGAVLGATTTDLPGGQLPLTMKPMRRAMNDLGMSKSEIMNAYRNAGNRDWLDGVENTQAWFHEKGIMGFSPSEWMAASHAQLVSRGMDTQEAADKVRDIYTYGTRGRSGLEQSVNFVFFPFSFQKKYWGQVTKFMSEDVGRTMLIHDSLKGYEAISEKYDLSDRWKDKLPILAQLRKINNAAFGISPGQFGGINRPYLDLIRATPGSSDAYDSIINTFLPQAVQINSKADADEMQRIAGRVIPIFRDSADLVEDIMDQAHVVSSPAHQSRQADAQRGWETYHELRDGMQVAAQEAGISVNSILAGRDQFAPIRAWYDQQIADIEEANPYWKESRVKSSQKQVARQAEISDIIRSPEGNQEIAMQGFESLVRRASEVVGENLGGNFQENADLMPQEVTSALRAEAVRLSMQVDGFGALYRRYYQNMLGPIHKAIG